MTAAVSLMVQALLATPAVTNIVGTAIDPDMVAMTTPRPCMRVYLVSEAVHPGLIDESGPFMARVTVESYADSSTLAQSMGEAVRTAFLTGRNRVIGGVDVVFSKAPTDHSFFDETAKTFRRVQDYLVAWG